MRRVCAEQDLIGNFPVKISLRLASVLLAVPAVMGVGFSAVSPVYAAPQCAAGTHWAMASNSCVADENSVDTSQPAPVPSTPSSTPSPVATQSPSASTSPVPRTDPTADPVPLMTTTVIPQPTVTVTQIVAPPVDQSDSGIPAVGSVPDTQSAPAGTTRTSGTTPAKSSNTSSSSTAPVLAQASMDSGPNKPLAIAAVIGLLLLIVAIIVYSWRRFGAPFPRKH